MPLPPWKEQGWLDVASAWIKQKLNANQLFLEDEITQSHIRPWSTVLTVPTNEGEFYFKASGPNLVFESRLTEALVRWQPNLMPELLAVDLQRGWMLMRSSGQPIRNLIREEGELNHWKNVLLAYAELQIELSGYFNELLSLGVFDRRLEYLPDQFGRLLDDTVAMCFNQPGGLTQSAYKSLLQLRDKFVRMCACLAEYDIPESLHHDDFHDANVFLQDGRYIFIDWGESCYSHPFFTLLVCLRSTAYSMKWEFDDKRLEPLRDAYLQPFKRFASTTELLAAYRLAVRVAMVNRALTWKHVISNLEDETRDEYAQTVPGWLMEFLKEETIDPIAL